MRERNIQEGGGGEEEEKEEGEVEEEERRKKIANEEAITWNSIFSICEVLLRDYVFV